MIQVLTKAGINPRRRGHNAPEYILKLHPFSSLTPPTLVTLFRTSRLRGKCDALLVVDLSASVSSGTTWEVDENGMYCSNDVSLPPSHLHSAYTFKAGQVLKAWTNDTVPSPPHPSLAPTPHWSRPYSHTPTDDLRTHTQAPIPPHIPPEEQAPMEDVGQNDPLQLSDSTRAALDQLLSQIDQATSTVETNLTADSYAALAALPLSYPWSCLVLDLKELLPILDRYVLSCIIASHATLFTDLTHEQALFPLLRALAQTIVNIISPQASLNTRPVLPKEIYKVEFWHAHLNYACLRASDAGLPGGGAARLAGDQLCHWNTLSPDAVFQATHLIVFLPPCLGAFVLSNHSSHNSAFFKFSSPDASASEGPTACVKQVANFPLPSLLSNQSDTLTKARAAAAEGYLSPFTIPLLAEPETLVQPARLNWVLRFPLPPLILFPTDASPLLPLTTMAPAHHKPLMLLSATRPTFHTMTQLLHTLKQLPLCNSRTQLLSSETSDALPQNPPLLLHRISKPGYSQALLGCTLRMSINFLGPIFPTSPPSLKAISLVTSAWINSSPSCPHLLLILRPCRPPSNNFEHLSALKLKWHRSHANPLHVVPLPLRLHRIPCHHIPNRPLLSLTLQVSRSLLRILPPPLPPTLSPLHSPPSLILRSPSLTPPLAVAPLVGTQIPFSQHSYQIVIPLGSNDQGLPR